LEIGVKVFAESFKEGSRVHSNTAYLTFVRVDGNGKPVKAIEAIPESEDEKRRYEEALQRRENRLKTRIKHN
ncbi:MAG TPA: acyl-CoA thioesterase, partial [Ignavibacteria bacterium]|nr:acyl-CoA thioesterase [Ignavibacteria bacterium]